MKKYNFYVGLFDKDIKVQKHSEEFFIYNITDVLSKYIHQDNFTIYDCKGQYKHRDGKVIQEPSLNVEVIKDGIILYQQLQSIKKDICIRLNQESILVTEQEVRIL